MKLTVIGSGSKGNCYLLGNNEEALIIEAGVQVSEIKKALKFDLTKVKGVLISHAHTDHSKSAKDLVKAGLNIYCQYATAENLNAGFHRIKIIEPEKQFGLGGFSILPFSLQHDVPCLGFLINHEKIGRTLFLTDSYYSGYTFSGLNNIIIEVNYCEEILNERMIIGTIPGFLRDRVLESHMSLQTCKELLKANDLRAVNNIVLIHLSDSNSDAARFKKEVENLTGKRVHVASKGLELNFNKQPF